MTVRQRIKRRPVRLYGSASFCGLHGWSADCRCAGWIECLTYVQWSKPK